jgi:hypothetical protein
MVVKIIIIPFIFEPEEKDVMYYFNRTFVASKVVLNAYMIFNIIWNFELSFLTSFYLYFFIFKILNRFVWIIKIVEKYREDKIIDSLSFFLSFITFIGTLLVWFSEENYMENEHPVIVNVQRFQIMFNVYFIGGCLAFIGNHWFWEYSSFIIKIRKRILAKYYNSRKISMDSIDDNKIKFDQTECRICLLDFSENKNIFDLKCGHLFHFDCLHQWLETVPKCPLCNETVSI